MNPNVSFTFDFSLSFLENEFVIPESYYGIILDEMTLNPSSSMKTEPVYLTEPETVVPLNVSNVFYKEPKKDIIPEKEKLVAALFKRAQENNLKGVQILFKKGGFDPNVKFHDVPLLEEAAAFGASDVVIWLVDTMNANILGRFDTSNRTPYRVAVEKGFSEIAEKLKQNTIKELYETARPFMREKNYSKAIPYYEEGVKMNDKYAEYNLAIIHELGLGIPRDYRKAGALYQRAAASGEKDAMIRLGGLYEQGLGYATNLKKAKGLYEAALAKGHADAQKRINAINKLIEKEATGETRPNEANLRGEELQLKRGREAGRAISPTLSTPVFPSQVPPEYKFSPGSLKPGVTTTLKGKRAKPGSETSIVENAQAKVAAEAKATANRLAAEAKAAEEKATANRLAAEAKAAEEKAAANKAAAEAKATANRLAAEAKAAEEKAAANKAAANKAAANKNKLQKLINDLDYYIIEDDINEFRKIFEENKLSPDAKIADDIPFLEEAAIWGSYDSAKYLLEKGANPLGRFDTSGITPYSAALESSKGLKENREKIAELLKPNTFKALIDQGAKFLASKETEKARQYFEEGDKLGDVNATYELYNWHMRYGTKEKQRELLEKAVSKGLPQAILTTGMKYYTGISGYPKNLQKAKQYMELAETKGIKASLLPKVLQELEEVEAKALANKAAAAKSVVPNLGWGKKTESMERAAQEDKVAKNVAEGMSKDYATAGRAWIRQAKSGNPDAYYYLAILFFNGWGVAKNEALANKFLETAARLGSKQAIESYGNDGVPAGTMMNLSNDLERISKTL